MVFSSKKSVANGNDRARECEIRGLEDFFEKDDDSQERNATAPEDVSGATNPGALAQDAAARARQGGSAAVQGAEGAQPEESERQKQQQVQVEPQVQNVTGDAAEGADVALTPPVSIRERLSAEARARHAKEKESADWQTVLEENEDWMDLGDKQVRKGPGVGCGVFDLRYVGDGAPIKRWGKNYLDKEQWTPVKQDDWETEMKRKVADARAEGGCIRLYKVTWQEQEISTEDLVVVMREVLKPVGEVDSLAAWSETFDCGGVEPNGQEKMEGAGGGTYMPVRMRDINKEWTEQELEQWNGTVPVGCEETGPGNGGRYWDAPGGYFTVAVPMLMADREEVMYNLCVQVTWHTLESTRLPEDLGYLSGDWFVEELHIRKREERMMVRLMQAAGTGIKLMLRPRRVGGMKMQMITGIADSDTKVQQMIKRLRGGIKLQWEGEDRLMITGKTDLLRTEQNSRSRSKLDKYWEERKQTDPKKMVLKPLGKQCKGEEYSRRLARKLQEGGVEGVVSVGFSPDKAPDNPSRGVVGFVVFSTVEQRDAALDDRELPSLALLGSEFLLGRRVVRSEAKEPERNVALDRKEAAHVKQLKAQAAAGKARQSGPVIRNEKGEKMQRAGEPVITGKLQDEAQDQLAVSLGKQMNDLFANLNKQWQEARKAEQDERKAEKEEAEAERAKMRAENAELRNRLAEVDKERREQHSQLMEVMKGLSLQLAGQPAQLQTPVREQNSSKILPVSIGKPQVVEQAVQRAQPLTPSTPTGREQAMESALRALLREGDTSGGAMRMFLEEQGHNEVAGMFAPECGEHSAAI